MKIAITGADGRMGRLLRNHWQAVHDLVGIGDEADLREPGDWHKRLSEFETIVHLAADLKQTDSLEVMKSNIDILVNVMRAAENAHRFVFASSMWVVHEQTSLGLRSNYYAASKQAGEAIVRAWSDVHRRPSVSLRLGHFGSKPGAIPVEHELQRIDEASLKWWFDKAIAYDQPSSVCWQATGMLNRL
jgi:nucleoside-diphosphate-sugar epimerase